MKIFNNANLTNPVGVGGWGTPPPQPQGVGIRGNEDLENVDAKP
ncbi:hypothetical protein FDUTEX481_03518 [Tolypothrix sp. PCC 7601]|nr:hypothetical protein FDUTEX481_03518 [Tolypothrix sp. PCC 7601]